MAKQRFSVCYHCKDRVVGCHATCEAYKKERKEADEHLAQQRAQKNITDTLYLNTGKRMKSESVRKKMSKRAK